MSWQTETRGWALASAGVFCMSAIGYLAISAGLTVNTTGKHVNATLMSAGDTLDQVKTQLPAIAADVHSATQAAHGAIATVTATVADVKADLPPLVKQATADLQEGHNLILEAGLTAMEARKASAEERAALPGLTLGVEDAIGNLNDEMTALQDVTRHADKLVSDPDIPTTIAHVESTTGHLDATAADVQQEVHSLTHPTWLHKLWGGVLDVAHVFNPL